MLKKIRKERGLSWARLSDMSGVPVSTLAHWEAGGIAAARVGSVGRVADALGCSIDDLMKDEGSYRKRRDLDELC